MTITEQMTAFDWQQATWQEAEDYVSRFTDRLGTPLETGIIETVIVLNLLGLRTFQSCEGHLTHGCAYPSCTPASNAGAWTQRPLCGQAQT
ncbi:MAG: hypothetical protein M3Z08_11095 [Chloroflexota bacterium]|nr:hypothetical protein [Chloroflexota bacterium]